MDLEVDSSSPASNNHIEYTLSEKDKQKINRETEKNQIK